MEMRVVVIDDDEQHLNLMRRHLVREGMEVLAIKNNGCNVTNQVRLFDPDVVLMDLYMPILPGDQLISIMKRDDQVPDAAYIVMSGGDATVLRRVQLTLKIQQALSKSSDLTQITHHIRSYETWKEQHRKERLLRGDTESAEQSTGKDNAMEAVARLRQILSKEKLT